MVKILDCTLRDGGYYNQWYFEDEFVKHYLNAMNASGVILLNSDFATQNHEVNLGHMRFLRMINYLK